MIKGNRINTEVPFSAPIVVYQCWCFCEHENVYNINANILDNGSEKPKYKHYGIDSKNCWDRCKDLVAAEMCYFQK